MQPINFTLELSQLAVILPFNGRVILIRLSTPKEILPLCLTKVITLEQFLKTHKDTRIAAKLNQIRRN